MDLEANKALVRRYLQFWATNHPVRARAIFAADYVDHSHPDSLPGPEPVIREAASLRQAFPDARFTIEHMLAEHDMVAFRFSMRGTHVGTFAGYPATGKELVLTGADFVRITNDQITELWSHQDTLTGFCSLA